MKNYKFLFDLGNVFFDWNPKYYFKNIFKNNFEMKYFLAEICNENWNIKQDAGRSIKEAEIELIKKFPKYNNFIKLYYKNHRKMINGVFQDSVDILKELKKKNFKCYVLSNWSSETFIGMKEEYPFLYQFDDIMISGETILNEAKESKKFFYDHFAHIIIHSILHINGYSHKNKKQFLEMKNKEIKILNKLGISNPYL